MPKSRLITKKDAHRRIFPRSFMTSGIAVFGLLLGGLGCESDIGESGGGPSVAPEPEPEVVLGKADHLLLATITRSFVFRGGHPNTQAEIDASQANPDPIFGSLNDDGAFARGGNINIGFFGPQDLPADTRERVDVGSQEFCTFESFPNDYPRLTPQGEWPAERIRIPSENITINVDDAPGRIVYESDEGGFYFRNEPAAIQIGEFEHRDFFEPEFLPFSQSLTVDVEAGSAIGGLTYQAEMPDEFSTSRPDMVSGDTTIDVNEDQTFSWQASDGSSRMMIEISDGTGLVRCDVADDGETIVPRSMMNKFAGGQFSVLNIRMRREFRNNTQVQDSNGQIIDVRFISSYMEIGRFPNLEDSR